MLSSGCVDGCKQTAIVQGAFQLPFPTFPASIFFERRNVAFLQAEGSDFASFNEDTLPVPNYLGQLYSLIVVVFFY